MNCKEILAKLRSLRNPIALAGMARFGINTAQALGVSMPELKRMAKQIGKDHALAEQLWASGLHEARLLAALIDDPSQVTEEQMERWVKDFDSWDICDQVCNKLFDRTPWTYAKALEWPHREEEFVKRTGYVLMTQLAVHDKTLDDSKFESFYPLIIQGATDTRNFVKKAVNWAVRQIGKRNAALNKRMIDLAREIQKIDSKASRWIAADALRELTSQAVQDRLNKNAKI